MHHEKEKKNIWLSPFLKSIRHDFCFYHQKKNPEDILKQSRERGKLVQKGEHARMNDIQGSVGISFLNDAGYIDLAGTCRGEGGLVPIKGKKGLDRQLCTHLARSFQYSHCSLPES